MSQRVIFFLHLFFSISLSCLAVDDQIVKIKNVSSSGRTIYLDKGKYEEIADDDYGVLIEREKLVTGKYIHKPIAKIKLVKLYARESVWIAYKVFVKASLIPGKKLTLISESAMLKGRAKLKVKRTSVVTNKYRNKEVQDFMLEGDELAKKSDKYSVISVPHKKEKHYEYDADLIDVKKWKSKLGNDQLYVSGLYRSPHAKEFSERVRVKTFEKMVVAYLNKYNDPSFNYKEFYLDQKRSGSGYLSARSVFGDYKDKYDERKLSDINKKKKYIEDLRKKGEAWSDSYSDKQLSEILTKLSIAKEKNRRKTLVAFKFDYQAYLGFGLNLINNENINDSQTTEQSKYDFELGLEGYFFNALRSLDKFTMEFSVRNSKDAFFGGDLNARSNEYSVATHFNWYPFRRPSTINANIIYFGILSRFGIASLSNITSEEVGTYQVFTLPGFRAGLKYNFDNSYGFRVTGGYENIRVERIVRNADDGSLPNRASYVEGKVSVSLSKFF